MTEIAGAELVYSSLPHTMCRCGKRGYASREIAEQVVVKAKIARTLYGNRRRAEVRTYPCDIEDGVWHVTSQIGGRGGSTPRPRYEPDDDEAAREFLSAAVFFGDERPWAALHAPRYCAQTLRVLQRMHQSVQLQLNERRKVLAQADAARASGRISGRRYRELGIEHARWRAEVIALDDLLRIRISTTRDALKQVNILRAQGGSRYESVHHRDVVRRLALEIRRHQRAVGEEYASPEDRRLWALLDQIEIPQEAGKATLAEVLAESWVWADDLDNSPITYAPFDE